MKTRTTKTQPLDYDVTVQGRRFGSAPYNEVSDISLVLTAWQCKQVSMETVNARTKEQVNSTPQDLHSTHSNVVLSNEAVEVGPLIDESQREVPTKGDAVSYEDAKLVNEQTQAPDQQDKPEHKAEAVPLDIDYIEVTVT